MAQKSKSKHLRKKKLNYKAQLTSAALTEKGSKLNKSSINMNKKTLK